MKQRSLKARKTLQHRGTRSTQRRLITTSGRERRFIANHSHSLATGRPLRFPNSLIGLADLTNIRRHTNKGNRPKTSLEFICEVYGHRGHAHLVARNLTLRTLLARQG